ncbi:hypothetical protein ACFY0F_34985 [Streptomyces sp. NPDC001544]
MTAERTHWTDILEPARHTVPHGRRRRPCIASTYDISMLGPA